MVLNMLYLINITIQFIFAFILFHTYNAAYTLKIFGPNYAVHGATNIAFSCTLMSQKQDDIPIWYHNDRMIDFSVNSGYQTSTQHKGQMIETKLFLDRATLNKSGSYKCQRETKNIHIFNVVIFDSKNLVTFVNKPKFGEYNNVILKCEVSSKTPVAQKLTFNWKFFNGTLIKNDSKKYLMDDNSLTILHPTIKDSTKYMCYSQQRPEIKDVIITEAPVRVKPITETGSVSLVEGDSLKMKCEAIANPAPSLRWFRKRDKDEIFHELNAAAPGLGNRISFNKDKPEDITNSTLIIKNMAFEDKGSYSCRATNGKSEHNSTISVRMKDKLAALWPFLGICLEVAILCTIILIYEKRRSKKNAEKEANLASKKISTTYKSDDEEDPKIRHRKA